MKKKEGKAKSLEELERRTTLHEKFAKEINSLSNKVLHAIVFALGTQEFAIEVGKIDQVIVTPKIIPLPKTPKYIPGIVTVHAKGIIILDLAAKLGLENIDTSPEDQGLYTLIVSSEKFTIGILVNEVPKNLKINGSKIQATSLHLAGTPEDETYIKGLIHLEEHPVFYIDIDELIESDRMEARALIEA